MHVLDLAAKDVDSLYTLKEFCPRIEHLDVSNNKLSHLEGAPFTIRQLHAQGNKLSPLTNWAHLSNLQYLDVSGNELESLDGFTGLIHLRELKASNNRISSIKGILDIDGLLSLTLSSTDFESIDLRDAGFTRLTSLNVSNNKLTGVLGLEAMSELTLLDISNNELKTFPSLEIDSDQIPHLETLRCANNSIDHLDVSRIPRLRLLYADCNRLETIMGIQTHACLETVALCEQAAECGLTLAANITSFSEIRNLYLSGNKLPSLPITSHFLNLQTLEVAFTGLSALPANFGTLVPNLRTLNLNSNSLKDLRALRGILKLRRLHVAEKRLSRLRKTIAVVERFASSLEELDLRSNPFSLGFHTGTPLCGAAADVTIAKNHTLQQVLPAADADKDAQHLARLDEDTRLRRRVYELLLGTKCAKLASIDGLKFSAATALRRDEVWERLKLGVVEKTGDDGTEEL